MTLNFFNIHTLLTCFNLTFNMFYQGVNPGLHHRTDYRYLSISATCYKWVQVPYIFINIHNKKDANADLIMGHVSIIQKRPKIWFRSENDTCLSSYPTLLITVQILSDGGSHFQTDATFEVIFFKIIFLKYRSFKLYILGVLFITDLDIPFIDAQYYPCLTVRTTKLRTIIFTIT